MTTATMTRDREALLAPRYGIAEAARLIPGLSPTTLRSWVMGRTYPTSSGTGRFDPLITLPDPGEPRLSFINLVESHILYGLRSSRELSIADFRTAVEFAEENYEIVHLLAHHDIRTMAGDLLLDRYGELVNLTKAGQLGMKTILHAYLRRLNYGNTGLAISLAPIVPWAPDSRDYLINPLVAYGRPIIVKHGVPVEVVADRYNGGESLGTLARDYGLKEEEVETAISYARAA